MGSRYAAGRWCCASRRRDRATALRYSGWQRRKVVATIQPAVEFFGNSLAWLFLRTAPVATQMPVFCEQGPLPTDRYDDCVAVDSRRCASAYTSGGRGPSSAVRRLSARCSMLAVPTIVVCMLGLEMV